MKDMQSHIRKTRRFVAVGLISTCCLVMGSQGVAMAGTPPPPFSDYVTTSSAGQQCAVPVTDATYTGNGYYGYGGKLLGTATLYFYVTMVGAKSVSTGFWFRSTRGTTSIYLSGDRLYLSGTYPGGRPVSPSQYKDKYLGSRNAQSTASWGSPQYSSYESTTAWASIVHEATWKDPSSAYPGRWYILGEEQFAPTTIQRELLLLLGFQVALGSSRQWVESLIAMSNARAASIARVYVNWLDPDAQRWVGSWQYGPRHVDYEGDHDSVIAWAKQQPAAERLIFDATSDMYVPLE